MKIILYYSQSFPFTKSPLSLKKFHISSSSCFPFFQLLPTTSVGRFHTLLTSQHRPPSFARSLSVFSFSTFAFSLSSFSVALSSSDTLSSCHTFCIEGVCSIFRPTLPSSSSSVPASPWINHIVVSPLDVVFPI